MTTAQTTKKRPKKIYKYRYGSIRIDPNLYVDFRAAVYPASMTMKEIVETLIQHFMAHPEMVMPYIAEGENKSILEVIQCMKKQGRQ